MDDQAPITQLLAAWREGDAQARDHLLACLYPELRRLAGQLFRRERSDHTLQPTALVHEAWLRLSGSASIDQVDRGHLLAITARLMRQILIDHARRRSRHKRDGGQRLTLSQIGAADSGADGQADTVDLIALDAALEQLEQIDAQKARIVELRYFSGLSIEETAQALASSPATVKRHWQAARLWLYQALQDNPPPPA
ncbi:MAG: sigma-70 family RNA polymerase sigma factor [Xanthomonadales bacterium]|nr:sigma-70 family RNA polymerase sigma factor [Xanthomonadales bacterium]